MKKASLLPIALLILLLASCSIAKTGITEISFGQGGGFTGVRETSTLHANATLDGKVNKVIPPKKCKAIFKQANALQIDTINEPENMYKFIEITRKSGKTMYMWGFKTEVPEELKSLYTNLKSLEE